MPSNVLQIIGYKNAGKTTLLCGLVGALTSRGKKVATLKHDAHEFQMDHADTDTAKHQKAGAWMTGITSPSQTAWIKQEETSLASMLASASEADIILVEGFKQADYPKMAVLRGEEDGVLLHECRHIVAVYSRGGTTDWIRTTGYKGVIFTPEHDAAHILRYLEDQGIVVF